MPWNWEVTDPESEGIVLNPETAARKGLKDGDWVALEDRFGGKTTGRLIVKPTIHPDSVETSDYGHYQTPISRGRGIPSSAEIEAVNTRLISINGEIKCSGGIVKIYKTEEIIPNKPAV
jgi:anaerobic selenocysteine-containing dehydrogenase